MLDSPDALRAKLQEIREALRRLPRSPCYAPTRRTFNLGIQRIERRLQVLSLRPPQKFESHIMSNGRIVHLSSRTLKSL